MQTLISIIIALIIFSVLVIIHEFGHFIVAKKCGVVVNEFSVGMGPRIVSRVAKSGTRYSLKALPIGGSCAMLGEDEDNNEEGSFNSKSIWARMAIVFAGPFFNFILAFLLALIVIGAKGADVAYVTHVEQGSPAYMMGLRDGDRITNYNGATITFGREIALEEMVNPIGKDEITVTYRRDFLGRKLFQGDDEKHTISFQPMESESYILGISYSRGDSKAEIEKVPKDSAMDKAGIRAGDVVTEINGKKITSGNKLEKYFDKYPLDGSEVTIKLDRNGKEIEVKVIPQMTKQYDDGIEYNIVREKQSLGGVLKYSLIEMRYEINTVLKSLKMLVTGKVSANEISGPVGIVNIIGDTYTATKSAGVSITILTLLNLAIMLSANLGVMNLLPIPALDGGRLFIYIIEIIIRRPIPKDKEGMIHFIGFILLMALMLFLVFNDVRKLIF